MTMVEGERRPRGRARHASVVLALGLAVMTAGCTGVDGPPGAGGTPSGSPTPTPRGTVSPTADPPVTYVSTNFWLAKHDKDPVDPRSTQMIRAMIRTSTTRSVFLSGTDSSRWGAPYYEADAASPTLSVRCPADPCYDFPSSGDVVFRIPSDALPSDDRDRELVVIDRSPGVNAVLWLWRACPPIDCGSWTAHGMSITAIASDELDRCWARSFPTLVRPSDLQNSGHRGFPGLYQAVRFDEVTRDRAITHVLRVAIPDTASSHVYPFVGDEGRGGTIPEGSLLRLKPTADLSKLSPAARVIARALQTYGAVVGDTSGGPVELKVENLFVEHSSHRWAHVKIDAGSLATLPLSDYEVVMLGFGAPSPNPAPCASS
jgi:hypothetical protein